jgi:glycosyltransferase involved in cell wall biosynthesis
MTPQSGNDCAPGGTPGGFKIISIISTFNEGDIISQVLRHLIRDGVDAYILDNESTDDTVAQAAQWLGRGLINIESFPRKRDPLNPLVGYFPWRSLLQRKEQLARELDADWFMHQDADEIRESPWPDCTLAKAIERVHENGFNCIDFEVFNFRPVDDGYRQGNDPAEYFTHYEPAEWFDRFQIKGWRADVGDVALTPSAGHIAIFSSCRIFPIKFIMRHYPIRGDTHGNEKVFRQRKDRFLPNETRAGWHRQYDRYESPHRFVWDRRDLIRFDGTAVRKRLLQVSSGQPRVFASKSESHSGMGG